MMNRSAIFAAIEEQLGSGGGKGGFAVMVVAVRDLGLLALRFGCEQGEQAEAGIEKLIKASLRPCDTVIRSGDETFAVILPQLHTRNQVLLAITKLQSAFESPLILAPGMPPWSVRIVMGATLHPQDGQDVEALWRQAQMAAHDAASSGDRYAFHDLRDSELSIDYQDLRDSIDANRLATWFQPIMDLQRGGIVGAESLARWTSRILGTVSPDDFVTFAEQNDLILSLTRWSIHATFRYAAALAGAPGFLFAINLSPRVLSRPGLVEQLFDALRIWGVAPTSVIAEVTETALARDMDSTVLTLRRLRDQGVRVAIDDFGTGFASITYLSKFPASELKIDKSLVGSMREDPRMAKLVDSSIKLAHNLGLDVTAEGIENAETQHTLAAMGCDLGQGYHLGKPEPAAEFVARFQTAADN
ncbi:MAG: diguanylate cyclase/phosphodiesterase (GGDEF & EAL domains) with PAS/PAC sensor(s) [Rhodanobacteraceae bacterium]|jgi:diguanylate cyclase (GGDEF)-like protein|nr:MAG: diguanylate cyclase/phosphodiesterase (GGDEF & EAL domains) with PAS/PAC sensor(s) [Rhodanobacteraceae bacterium]